MLLVAHKDVLPTTQKSSVIYEYKCRCDSRYVGRTSRRLHYRIKQHAPQWFRQQLTRPRRSQSHRSCKRNDTKPDCDSAIGQHFLENDQCTLNYDNKRFSILATARSSFHFNLLEQGCQTRGPHAALAAFQCGPRDDSEITNEFWQYCNGSSSNKRLKPRSQATLKRCKFLLFGDKFTDGGKVMTFFGDRPSGSITEIVAQRSGDLQIQNLMRPSPRLLIYAMLPPRSPRV